MRKQQILKECCGIYGYKNKKTGKIHYIGQTIQPFIKRGQEHKRNKDNLLSDNKIQKHPTEYEMIPLVIFKPNSITNEDLNPIETEFIKLLNTFHDNNPDGWNLTMGGKSHTISEETREKLSKSLTGVKRSLFTRVKMSIAKKGISRPQTRETRQKLRVVNLGRNNPNDKYILWDSGKCYYSISHMYNHNNNGFNPLRCFAVKYNGYKIPCGYNLDFFSCELISDLVSEIVIDV